MIPGAALIERRQAREMIKVGFAFGENWPTVLAAVAKKKVLGAEL